MSLEDAMTMPGNPTPTPAPQPDPAPPADGGAPAAPAGGVTDDQAQALLADAVAAAEAENGNGGQSKPGDGLPDDPVALKAMIGNLRKENGAARTNAKAAAAQEARDEFAQQIGKVLGLVKDEPLDPAKLTEQLQTAQALQREAALELAVHRAAPDRDAAADLLDSRAFLAKVKDLDPSDADAIATAVNEAVQARGLSGKRLPAPNPAQGSSANGAPSIDSLIAEALKKGDTAAYIRLQNQKLAQSK